MPTYDYHRLIAMRECLRQVQKLLPKRSDEGKTFMICYVMQQTNCSSAAREDTQRYVMASIHGHTSFEGCMMTLNNYRTFGPVEIMQLRQKFIDSLCDRLNIEIEKVRP